MKRIIIIALSAGALGLSIFLAFLYFGFFSPFQIVQGGESAKVLEVSENGTPMFEFSRPVKKSFVEENLVLNPNISHHIEWVNARVFKLVFDKPLTAGARISVSSKKLIQDILGNELAQRFYYNIFVIGKPEVVLALPKDTSEVKNKIIITFNHPMVPLSTLDEEDARKTPVKIEPAIAGSFKWLGTSALEFIPQERFAYATHYTVTVDKNMSDISGGSLNEDYIFGFDTPRPALLFEEARAVSFSSNEEIENSLQGYSDFFGNDTIKINFNQELLLDTVQKSIRLVRLAETGDEQKSKKEIPEEFSLAYAQDLKGPKRPLRSETSKSEPLRSAFILTLKNGWKELAEYRLEINNQFRSIEGNIAPEEKVQIFSFSGVVPFAIQSVAPQEGAIYDGTEIQFSAPLDSNQFSKFITIEPKAKIFNEDENVYLQNNDKYFSDYWDLKPSQKYTVTISKDLPDRFGRKLEKDYTWSFTTAPLNPNLYLKSRSENFGVFESGMPPNYRIGYVNIKKLNFALAKLSFTDVLKIRQQSHTETNFLWSPNPTDYQVIDDWSLDIPENLDVSVLQNLDIANHLGKDDQRFDSGIFLLDIWSTEVKYYGKIIHNTQIFSLTPYALTLKYSRNQAFVFASSLKTAQPIEDMKLSFLSLDGKTQYTAKTNKKGMVNLPIEPEKLFTDNREFFVLGEKDGKEVWIGSDWNSGIEPWKFSLAERSPGLTDEPHQILGSIVTDRPLYKPGETIYFKGIVRDFDQAKFIIPQNTGVTVKLFDNEQRELSKKDYKISDFGSFSGEFFIPNEVSYGYFRIEAEVHLVNKSDAWSKTITQSIWVNHFQKAPFKVSVNIPQAEYFWGDTVKGTVTAETYYGARLANQKVNLSVNSTDYYFNRYQDDWYSFSVVGNWCYYNCNRTNHSILSESKTLDSQGSADFSFPIESKKDESNPARLSQVYIVSASVSDAQSGKEVSGAKEFTAHYTDIYLGVKTAEYMVTVGQEAEFQAIALDPQGNPKQTSFTATLIKREYKTIKRKNVDGDFYYENETKDTEISSKDFTTDKQGRAKGSFLVESGGSFIIRVSGKDSAGREIIAETEIWVSSREAISWPRANHDRVEIIADKKEYNIGDVAKLMVKSPYTEAKALITTEQDSVLTKRLIDVTSNAQIFNVLITEDYVPNVYVSVIILKGRTEENQYDDKKRDIGQPDFKVGYIKLPVNTASKKLAVSIKTDKERYEPQEEVTLNFSTKDSTGKGAPAELAVMVVDMSLLALTGYTEPDLVSSFYSERGLGVKTSLTMSKFIERFKPGAKGGGGGEKKARGDFKNTAYWIASLVTNAEGNAVTKFKLPDNLTTWKVTVVAQDKLHRFGAGNMEFLETKKLMLDPALPQFLIAGDEIEIPVVVTNRQTTAIETQVKFSLEDSTNTELKSTIIGKDILPLNLKADERKEVRFIVKAGAAGQLNFHISAESGKVDDSVIETRRINPLSSKEVVSTSGQFETSAREVIFLPKAVIAGMGGIDLNISPTLAYLLPKNLELLRSYPYECVEQTISKIFPNALILHNKILVKLFPEKEKKEIENLISAGLSKIYTAQSLEGSWGYFAGWSSGKYENYLTSYVLIALEEMKKSGATIDEKVLEKARSYLATQKDDLDLVVQGFVRWALSYSSDKFSDAEYAKRTLGKILSDPESQEALNFPRFALVYWAMATKDMSILKPVLQSAQATDRELFFDELRDGSTYWNTPKRTTAFVLYALENLEPNHPYIPKIIHWMNTNRSASGFGNTQESVWTLLALIRHIENEKLDELNTNVSINLAGENIFQTNISTKNILENTNEKKKQALGSSVIDTESAMVFASKQVHVPLEKLPQNEDFFLDFAKQGKGKIYYDAVLSYFLPVENIKPREEGFSIIREYFSLDGKKLEVLPKVGETFKVHLTIVAPKEGNFVAVEDFVPAGVMPINTAFATERNDIDEQLKNSTGDWWTRGVLDYFRHQEFRDDRVFLFAEELPAGVYEYEYAARVTHKGNFLLLPARVFEMYNEDRFGRTKGDRVIIDK